MPMRVPTISITVIRDGKRVTPVPNKKAFDFTADEIASVTAQHPSAFRKPINEESDQDTATGATAPEKTVKPTANTANKVPGKKKTAQKTADVPAKPDPEIADEDGDEDETETETDADDDAAGEDDDI